MNRIKGVDSRDKPGHDAERAETTSKIAISCRDDETIREETAMHLHRLFDARSRKREWSE